MRNHLQVQLFFVVVPKLGIFVLLLRIFYFGFFDSWRNYVILIAIANIIVGSVAGLEQRKLKSLLAYSFNIRVFTNFF